jgi:hypothetical protein
MLVLRNLPPALCGAVASSLGLPTSEGVHSMARIAVDDLGGQSGRGVPGRLIHAAHGHDLQWLVVTDGEDRPGEISAACSRRWGCGVFTSRVEAYDPDVMRFRTMTLLQADPALAEALRAESLARGTLRAGPRRFRLLAFTHFPVRPRVPPSSPSLTEQLRTALRGARSATRNAQFEALLTCSHADANGRTLPGPSSTHRI